MADTDTLKPYTLRQYPLTREGQERFLPSELREVSESIASLVAVLKKLEARLVAGGL